MVFPDGKEARSGKVQWYSGDRPVLPSAYTGSVQTVDMTSRIADAKRKANAGDGFVVGVSTLKHKDFDGGKWKRYTVNGSLRAM